MALKTRRLAALCLLTTLSVACSTESRLRSTGPTPYVRCLAAPVPGDRSWAVGPAKLVLKGRIITVTGLPSRPRIAAFTGPGFGPALNPGALGALGKAAADLIFVLGGLGETDAEAIATVSALTGLGRPVFVLAGGRDRWSTTRAALSAFPTVVDLTPLQEVRIGKHTLLPIAGADSGRYSVDAAACGFSRSDLEARAKALGSPQGPRWLVAWHAPAAPSGQAGITRTATGVDTGSWNLSRFASQVGANGGFYAWPTTQAGRSVAGAHGSVQLLVPRLWGPREQRDDGSLAPLGFALLALGDTTLEAVR